MFSGALLAIDPGVSGYGCACAAFAEGRLVYTWFERAGRFNPHDTLPPAAPGITAVSFDVIVIERPVLQGERTRAARPQDLMALAWEGAMLAGMFAGRDSALVVEWPANDTPGVRGWKGSEPKPVQHARLWAVLDAEEQEIVGGERVARAIFAAREKGALNRWGRPGGSYYPRAFVMHNQLDAIALGCTYLGRLERTG
jgi:hypothetical protein